MSGGDKRWCLSLELMDEALALAWDVPLVKLLAANKIEREKIVVIAREGTRKIRDEPFVLRNPRGRVGPALSYPLEIRHLDL